MFKYDMYFSSVIHYPVIEVKGNVKKNKTCAKELKYTTQRDPQENNIVNIDQKIQFSVQIIKYKSFEIQQKF